MTDVHIAAQIVSLDYRLAKVLADADAIRAERRRLRRQLRKRGWSDRQIAAISGQVHHAIQKDLSHA